MQVLDGDSVVFFTLPEASDTPCKYMLHVFHKPAKRFNSAYSFLVPGCAHVFCRTHPLDFISGVKVETVWEYLLSGKCFPGTQSLTGCFYVN